MHIVFLNPQGNFDRGDSYWTEHADFGGQLVYVRNVAMALGELGHRVDIVTRRVLDPQWPEFAAQQDAYEDAPNVRILRIPCGPQRFLRKEDLWPYLVTEWVPNIVSFYGDEGALPETVTAHYGDAGIAAAALASEHHLPYTFTAHSLGAQKADELGASAETLADLEARYHFASRLLAERTAMAGAGVIITSTEQERRDQYGHPAYADVAQTEDDQRYAVIPPGVNLAVFDEGVRSAGEVTIHRNVDGYLTRDLSPERLGLPAIVASSRLDPKKNVAGLVAAYASSPTLQARANLVLITGAIVDPLRDNGTAGATERAELAAIRQVIASNGLAGSVAGFGIRGQAGLAATYRHLAKRGSVFAATALYEPFGLAPLEAAAAGLAVVATQNGGPSESLKDHDGEYGVLVDPTRPESIVSGLERALGPDHLALAAAGRQRVLDRYTWAKTAAGYLGALDRASQVDRPSVSVPPAFTDPSAAEGPTTADLGRWLAI